MKFRVPFILLGILIQPLDAAVSTTLVPSSQDEGISALLPDIEAANESYAKLETVVAEHLQLMTMDTSKSMPPYILHQLAKQEAMEHVEFTWSRVRRRRRGRHLQSMACLIVHR